MTILSREKFQEGICRNIAGMHEYYSKFRLFEHFNIRFNEHFNDKKQKALKEELKDKLYKEIGDRFFFLKDLDIFIENEKKQNPCDFVEEITINVINKFNCETSSYE